MVEDNVFPEEWSALSAAAARTITPVLAMLDMKTRGITPVKAFSALYFGDDTTVDILMRSADLNLPAANSLEKTYLIPSVFTRIECWQDAKSGICNVELVSRYPWKHIPVDGVGSVESLLRVDVQAILPGIDAAWTQSSPPRLHIRISTPRELRVLDTHLPSYLVAYGVPLNSAGNATLDVSMWVNSAFTHVRLGQASSSQSWLSMSTPQARKLLEKRFWGDEISTFALERSAFSNITLRMGMDKVEVTYQMLAPLPPIWHRDSRGKRFYNKLQREAEQLDRKLHRLHEIKRTYGEIQAAPPKLKALQRDLEILHTHLLDKENERSLLVEHIADLMPSGFGKLILAGGNAAGEMKKTLLASGDAVVRPEEIEHLLQMTTEADDLARGIERMRERRNLWRDEVNHLRVLSLVATTPRSRGKISKAEAELYTVKETWEAVQANPRYLEDLEIALDEKEDRANRILARAQPNPFSRFHHRITPGSLRSNSTFDEGTRLLRITIPLIDSDEDRPIVLLQDLVNFLLYTAHTAGIPDAVVRSMILHLMKVYLGFHRR